MVTWTGRELRAFIGSQGMASYICPSCHTVGSAELPSQRSSIKPIRVSVRCDGCGSGLDLLVERRAFARKSVRLPGTLVHDKHHRAQPMTVLDLSRGGVGFETDHPRELKPGDKLTLEFVLERTTIRRTVRVCSVAGRRVGAAFVAPKKPYDRLCDAVISMFVRRRK